MRPVNALLTGLLASATLLYAAPSLALSFDATSGIEARGRVDIDGFGGLPSLSNLTETEETQPFSRSVVSVTDAQPGTFAYFSSADIGNLEFKVSGSLTNSGTAEMFGFGVPILLAVAEARDIVTLSTARTDPFDVTLQLAVNGNLTAGNGSDIRANSLIALGVAGQLSTSDSALYSSSVVQDTLSVTKTVSGPLVVLDIDALLSTSVFRVAAGDTVSGQLANTAFLTLIVPSDVTITASDSGTFGVPIPVPEPTTAVLSSLGLLLVLGIAKRKLLR